MIVMKIFIASDHGGFTLKEILKKYLQDNAYIIEDCGCFSKESVDYPDIAHHACHKLLESKDSLGILICGTGVGISMAANKVPGIRAALCVNEYMAEMTKKHNNANVLCLGARVIGDELAKSIVKKFIHATFEKGRHEIRVKKIEKV
jgi:ribose 5-phosphate isomerase B